MRKNITIGITDCSKFQNYERWIQAEAGINVVRLQPHEDNFSDISKCDGIVLSGGEDVHPRYYNKSEYVARCEEIDETRDAFELRVLEYTEKKQLPLLGICRGLQIANVFFGGTLLPHIPDYGKFDHSRTTSADRYHTVQVDPNSHLSEVVQALTGEVNSAHHQAADLIGKGLVANALSPDGVVEGIERANKLSHSFLLLVQWHPERMKNQDDVFTKNIRRTFLDAVRNS